MLIKSCEFFGWQGTKEGGRAVIIYEQTKIDSIPRMLVKATVQVEPG
jgi:hypothetical protein